MEEDIQKWAFYVVLALIVLLGVLFLVVLFGGLAKGQTSGFWGMFSWILGSR